MLFVDRVGSVTEFQRVAAHEGEQCTRQFLAGFVGDQDSGLVDVGEDLVKKTPAERGILRSDLRNRRSVKREFGNASMPRSFTDDLVGDPAREHVGGIRHTLVVVGARSAIVQKRGESLSHELEEENRFRGEIRVDGALGEPCGPGDLIHTRLPVADSQEMLVSRSPNGLPNVVATGSNTVVVRESAVSGGGNVGHKTSITLFDTVGIEKWIERDLWDNRPAHEECESRRPDRNYENKLAKHTSHLAPLPGSPQTKSILLRERFRNRERTPQHMSPEASSRRSHQSTARHARARARRRRFLVTLASVVVIVIVVGVGYAVYTYNNLNSGLHRSALKAVGVKTGVTQTDGATNILVMGLDSRLDENGNSLPAATYNALHAGDGSDGGYNTNVLMLIHIPRGNGHAIGISIPRDDWVSFPNDPYGESQGKIKQAYGLELAQVEDHLVNTEPNETHAEIYQQARAAARQEEVETVSQFLGGVPIDHFVEVTMAAFYELAEAVQPIEVCLQENTSDPYSGANFTAGYHELSASQAVSFVRQRRDVDDPGLDFTDLDRERRQQAFIISLLYKLEHENLFTNFGLMQQLIDTAKQNIAIDSGLNLLSFASDANRFAKGGITFDTLPITGFATIDGQDANTVNLQQIQAETAQLIAASNASSIASTTPRSRHDGKSKRSTTNTSAAQQANATPTPSATPDVATEWQNPISAGSIPCVK